MDVLAASLLNGRTVSCECRKRRAVPWTAEEVRRNAVAKEAIRRARKTGAGGSHTQAEIDALYRVQRGKCANPVCRVALRGEYHRDHVLPITQGGSSYIQNIQLLCQPCNARKWSKHPIDWAQENGLLL
jgi:5-methylcytosine-specific restriction endonuclease McrA